MDLREKWVPFNDVTYRCITN